MVRRKPRKKKDCLECKKRPHCTKLCKRIRRMLPSASDTPGVSMVRGVPLVEDIVAEDVWRPADFASYANQKLLKLADAIQGKFTEKQWRALNLIWARGYRRSEVAELEGVNQTLIDRRMEAVGRILREAFVKRD